MRHFSIITNETKDSGLTTTHLIKDYLTARGATAQVCPGEHLHAEMIDTASECIIVLGGDGTLLRAARATSSLTIPLMGVNLGTLGYLASVEAAKVTPALDQLLENRFTREERMMLSGKKTDGESNYALNDIAIVRYGSLQMIDFHIYVNGQMLNTYHADGVVISTPTGSTGYNLSAGGPIVEPRAELILVTPICPHTLNTRTIILSAQDRITIELAGTRHGEEEQAEASFDGSDRIVMQVGDRIEIHKSKRTTQLLKLNDDTFLEVLRKKMSAN
ncbi:MAG: NAD(+)/NADH kinase [Lachnospiraceae bacterium]|nr:NAD(+)/NADH kinase [Lachnospiraceae bacterium]